MKKIYNIEKTENGFEFEFVFNNGDKKNYSMFYNCPKSEFINAVMSCKIKKRDDEKFSLRSCAYSKVGNMYTNIDGGFSSNDDFNQDELKEIWEFCQKNY